MSRSALVLAAHGGGDDSAQNVWLRTWAQRLRRGGLYDEVAVAFNLGAPHYSEVIDELDAEMIVVVPVLTSDGHFYQKVLPEALRQNRRYDACDVRITPPLGTHPTIARLFCQHAAGALARYRLDPAQTTLLVVGHGSRRDTRSQTATAHLANLLAERRLCRYVDAAYLEADPTIQEVAAQHRDRNLVVLPFFIGGAVHTQRDLPAALGVTLDPDVDPPTAVHSDGRAIVFAAALGHEPAIADIIRDLAGIVGIRPEGPTYSDPAELHLLDRVDRMLRSVGFRATLEGGKPA